LVLVPARLDRREGPLEVVHCQFDVLDGGVLVLAPGGRVDVLPDGDRRRLVELADLDVPVDPAGRRSVESMRSGRLVATTTTPSSSSVPSSSERSCETIRSPTFESPAPRPRPVAIAGSSPPVPRQ
jgi:hypothetical protein